MTYDFTFYLTAISLLVLANALFVAAEFALVRVRRTRIEELVAEGNATARLVKNALDHIDDYISTTQVGVTLASLGLGWIGEPFLAEGVFGPFLKWILPVELARSPGTMGVAHGVAIFVAFFAITFFHVVIGELTPKSLALQHAEKMSLYLIKPMRFFNFLFGPLVWLLRGSSARLLKMLGAKPVSSHSRALSEEELLMLLAESKRAGVVSAGEQQMLQRVFKFHDKTVREIMIPRPDIAALALRASEDEIKSVFEQGYSRLPVYDKNLNNVKGIVYVKDLIYTLQNPKLIKLIDLLREALFVPETQAVSTLLKEFQKSKVHMAIVIDEFGDTCGLVTLEDVIEEIVGEIQDEYDSEPAEVQRGSDGTIIFDGKTSIDRVRDLFPAFEMPEGSFETIAGLVFQLAGRVPKESDVLKHSGLAFRVTKREGRRLKKISVERLPAPTTPGEGGTAEAPTAAETAVSAESNTAILNLPRASAGHLEPAESVPEESAQEELASDDLPSNANGNDGDRSAVPAEIQDHESAPPNAVDEELEEAVPDSVSEPISDKKQGRYTPPPANARPATRRAGPSGTRR
jgi:CBS domain containing-hemolysin-like protein